MGFKICLRDKTSSSFFLFLFLVPRETLGYYANMIQCIAKLDLKSFNPNDYHSICCFNFFFFLLNAPMAKAALIAAPDGLPAF